MSDRVSIEITDHIAEVTLTRADKMNALDPPMLNAIAEAGAAVNREDIRAVVLTGAGKAFCAGLDMMSFQGMAQDALDGTAARNLMQRSHGDSNLYQQVAMVWHDLPVPVIAAVHGTVFGGGFQIMLGADIRIAAPQTRFSIMEMKWGLIPDMGGMVLLPRLARSDVIRRLTYTAEQFDSPDALTWGLITEIADDPLTRARSLATDIAGKSPSAIRAAKRLLDVAETAPSAEVLLAESREQGALIGGAHQMEAVMANMQKRVTSFK